MTENLEKTNKSTQINAKIHEQNANRLSEEVKKLQKELTLKDQISYIKNYLWNNVIEAIHDVWPSIQVIFEQRELLLAAQAEIQKTQTNLADKPEQVVRLINFLNNKNRQELEELKITDKTATILEIRKVTTKRNLMRQIEEKCEGMNTAITRFIVKFTNLRQK